MVLISRLLIIDLKFQEDILSFIFQFVTDYSNLLIPNQLIQS